MTRNLAPFVKWPLRLGLSAGFVGLSTLLLAAIFYYVMASTYDLDEVAKMPARTEILDRHGNILKNTKGQEIGFLHGKNRHLIKYGDVSPLFVKALISREDGRFRDHGAVDFRGIARSIQRAVTRGKAEGASTITMQLARNSYGLKKPGHGPLMSLHRKALEIAIAFRIESRFSKDEILEHYMNRIFWGGSIMGIESASRTYFAKSAHDLDLSESALLAGIIRAPNAFSPFQDLDAAKFERDTVLDRMVYFGHLAEDEAEAAKATRLNIPNASERIIQGTYALDAIRRDLEQILERENIKDGGLIIHTTLDPNIQEAAERSIEARLASIENTPGYQHQKRADWDGKGSPQYLQGAAVVIDNASGGVLAIVGGRDASESQFNRALQSHRPLGSIFKPFVYLAAVQTGFSLNESVDDGRIRPGEISGAPRDWSPTNSDGKYYGQVRAYDALIGSRNTSSIRVGTVAGLERVIETARMVGFDHDRIDRVPSSYLGSWGATTEEVASAYSIFPNGGRRFRPYYVTEIEDRDGHTLWKNGRLFHEAATPSAAWEVSRVLEQVNKRGTGRSIRTRFGFTNPSGGKTGTTNDYQDAWYAGYTSSLTCAVWVGLDTPKKTISGGEGARLALPIWADIMKTADRLPSYSNGPIGPAEAERVTPGIPMALPVE
ncbi:MAG: transglycosylase domain-containing protein [Verrucomicrobiaceae bacterium]